MTHILILVLLLAAAPLAQPSNDAAALRIVITALQQPNKLKVDGSQFRTKPNTKGKGVFVFDPRTRFQGTERYLLWLVLDSRAYALNGPSKTLTPALAWPRDAPGDAWKATGLDPYIATGAIEIVFGKKPS